MILMNFRSFMVALVLFVSVYISLMQTVGETLIFDNVFFFAVFSLLFDMMLVLYLLSQANG